MFERKAAAAPLAHTQTLTGRRLTGLVSDVLPMFFRGDRSRNNLNPLAASRCLSPGWQGAQSLQTPASINNLNFIARIGLVSPDPWLLELPPVYAFFNLSIESRSQDGKLL